MRIGRYVGVVAGLVLATGAAAEAQTARAGTRGRPAVTISVNGGAQVTQGEFQRSLTYPLYVEDAEVDGRYTVPSAPLFEAGVAVRVLGPLTAGVAVSRQRRQGSAFLNARLPHPLLPRQPRPLEVSVADLERAETAVHVQVAWLAPLGHRMAVAVFGGPTRFRVEQDTVRRLTLVEAYPFDDVSLGSTTTVRHGESAMGFHAGADAIYRLTPHVGLGAAARYSRANVDVPVEGGTFRLTAGGLHLTGGLRVLFW